MTAPERSSPDRHEAFIQLAEGKKKLYSVLRGNDFNARSVQDGAWVKSGVRQRISVNTAVRTAVPERNNGQTSIMKYVRLSSTRVYGVVAFAKALIGTVQYVSLETTGMPGVKSGWLYMYAASVHSGDPENPINHWYD